MSRAWGLRLGYQGRRRCPACHRVLAYANHKVPITEDPAHKPGCPFLDPKKLKEAMEKTLNSKLPAIEPRDL